MAQTKDSAVVWVREAIVCLQNARYYCICIITYMPMHRAPGGPEGHAPFPPCSYSGASCGDTAHSTQHPSHITQPPLPLGENGE